MKKIIVAMLCLSFSFVGQQSHLYALSSHAQMSVEKYINAQDVLERYQKPVDNRFKEIRNQQINVMKNVQKESIVELKKTLNDEDKRELATKVEDLQKEINALEEQLKEASTDTEKNKCVSEIEAKRKEYNAYKQLLRDLSSNWTQNLLIGGTVLMAGLIALDMYVFGAKDSISAGLYNTTNSFLKKTYTSVLGAVKNAGCWFKSSSAPINDQQAVSTAKNQAPASKPTSTPTPKPTPTNSPKPAPTSKPVSTQSPAPTPKPTNAPAPKPVSTPESTTAPEQHIVTQSSKGYMSTLFGCAKFIGTAMFQGGAAAKEGWNKN